MSGESRDRPRRSTPGEGRAPQGKPEEAGDIQSPAAAPQAARRKPPPASASQEGDALALPAGALVALRKSGGLVFRSREIVVYDDGRVETSTIGGGRSASAGTGQTLSRAELDALRRAVGRVGLDQLPTTVGQQRPDAFVYEITALVDGRPRAVEVMDGQIPPSVAPLIRQLNALLASQG
jgi:hypothetical protein